MILEAVAPQKGRTARVSTLPSSSKGSLALSTCCRRHQHSATASGDAHAVPKWREARLNRPGKDAPHPLVNGDAHPRDATMPATYRDHTSCWLLRMDAWRMAASFIQSSTVLESATFPLRKVTETTWDVCGRVAGLFDLLPSLVLHLSPVPTWTSIMRSSMHAGHAGMQSSVMQVHGWYTRWDAAGPGWSIGDCCVLVCARTPDLMGRHQRDIGSPRARATGVH